MDESMDNNSATFILALNVRYLMSFSRRMPLTQNVWTIKLQSKLGYLTAAVAALSAGLENGLSLDVINTLSQPTFGLFLSASPKYASHPHRRHLSPYSPRKHTNLHWSNIGSGSDSQLP